MDESLSDRLRSFGNEKFGSVKDFAAALEMKPPALQSYLSGRSEPGTPILKKLAALGCDVHWLVNGQSRDSHRKKSLEYRIVATVAAGNAEFFDRTGSFEFDNLDYDPEKYYFVVIDERNGESMFPMLKPGDSVLVNHIPDVRIKDRDIVLAKWDKKAAIKLYATQENKVVLSSLNISTPPIILSKEEVKCFRVKLIKKK